MTSSYSLRSFENLLLSMLPSRRKVDSLYEYNTIVKILHFLIAEQYFFNQTSAYFRLKIRRLLEEYIYTSQWIDGFRYHKMLFHRAGYTPDNLHEQLLSNIGRPRKLTMDKFSNLVKLLINISSLMENLENENVIIKFIVDLSLVNNDYLNRPELNDVNEQIDNILKRSHRYGNQQANTYYCMLFGHSLIRCHYRTNNIYEQVFRQYNTQSTIDERENDVSQCRRRNVTSEKNIYDDIREVDNSLVQRNIDYKQKKEKDSDDDDWGKDWIKNFLKEEEKREREREEEEEREQEREREEREREKQEK